MQAITEYTAHAYRSINRSLLGGVITQQANELRDALNRLDPLPGTTYRTFWVDELEQYATALKTSQTITFDSFVSTSRLAEVAAKFKGNVKLTIQGRTGRDIAPFSDSPAEQETLFLPGLTFQIKRVRVVKIGGRVLVVEAELIEL